MMTVEVVKSAGILRRKTQGQAPRTIVVLSRETMDQRNPVDVIVENFIYAIRYIIATGARNVFDRFLLTHIKDHG